MAAFYRDVLQLTECGREPGFIDFDAGGCRIALHRGASTVGRRAPKLQFYSADVAAARQVLMSRGAKSANSCRATSSRSATTKTSDGNTFTISNRA